MREPQPATSVIDARRHATAPMEIARAATLRRRGVTDAYRPTLEALVARAVTCVGGCAGAISVLVGETETRVACVGLDAVAIPRELSMCTHVVARGVPVVVGDAARDPYFAGNPRVTANGAGVRAYCGVPIRDVDGMILAVLCVVDGEVRDFLPAHVVELQRLASAAAGVLLDGPDALLPEVRDVARIAVSRTPDDGMLPIERDPLYAWLQERLPDDHALADAFIRRTGRRGILRRGRHQSVA